jgi:hypothetical protein
MSLPPEWGCSAVEWRTERDKVRLLRPPACDNVADVAAQMRENERPQPEVVLRPWRNEGQSVTRSSCGKASSMRRLPVCGLTAVQIALRP